MSRWQRPQPAPIPKRQAFTDRLRRIDPRVAVRWMLVGSILLLLTQLGWQWRTATVALGQQQTVMIVRSPIAAGSMLTDADIERARWPVALTPEGALPSLPAGAITSVDLVAGEVVVSSRLFPSADGLDVDERMVTIPQPLAPPPVRRGSVVELFGIMPLGDGITTPATRLTFGMVVEVTESAISIAVEASSVPTVIEHATLGTVEVVLMP